MANTPANSRSGTQTVDRASATADDRYSEVSWSRSGLLEGNAKGEMPWGRNRWWWVLPLALLPLLAIAALWGVGHIEGDVEEASRSILEANGIDTSGLRFEATYRDVEVSGTLPDGVDAATVVSLLEDEVGALEDEDIRVATISAEEALPAALGAINVDVSSDGSVLRLAGTVPSQDDKNALLAAAAATGLELVGEEDLTVSGLDPLSSNAPGQLRRMTSILGGLTAGSFLSADLNLGDEGPVTGTINAADAASAASLSATAEGGIEISSPPELGTLDTEITYDGTRIVLSGTVLSRAESDALVAAAQEVAGAANVVNNLEVSGLEAEVPGSQDRVDALASVIATFEGLASADATMNDTDLTVNGVALDEASADTTRTAVSASDAAGLRPGGELTVAEPVEPEISLEEEIDLLQAELDSLQDEIRENVVFATDSNVLSAEAQATLDKVVDAMNRYPRPVVEVGGHTDSQASEAYNLDLSQRRADAVVAYVSESIDAARLTPIGFGESQPIGDNRFEDGRLQNRRVEFIAKESF